MKRDLDLARQLLLDIEIRGTDCSVSVLRAATNVEKNETHDEKIRHHLRLLIDAGLLKEVDRTSSGIPCVRLTHEGHELLELARQDAVWHEAKLACQERMGGMSLRVIHHILLHWALGETSRYLRRRRPTRARRLRYAADIPHEEVRGAVYREPSYCVEPISAMERWEERELEPSEEVRYIRVPASGSATHWREDYRLQGPRRGVDVDGDGQIDYYETEPPTYLL